MSTQSPKQEPIEYALYPIKEIKALYRYKIAYQVLIQQQELLSRKYPALKEDLQQELGHHLED